MTDLNPQARQMADESMVRNLAAQARAVWPQEVPMLRRYALPAEPRILDAGCGTGEAASRLAELFSQARVLGVDIIDQHLEVARSRYARLDRQRSRSPRLRGVDGARGKRAGALGRIDRSRWRSHTSKHPAKREQRALRKIENDAVEVVEPAPRMPWFSFRYSHTEVWAVGRTARVKSKHARYEDGKLSTEAFEGELDRSVYDRMMNDAQRSFLDQTALFLRAFTAFLPFPGKQARDRE